MSNIRSVKRTIYDSDHEAFRGSVKEFLDRQVVPHLEEHADAHALPRDFWIEAGKQGFLGLEVPEEYGGQPRGEPRDYRFTAVLTEELAKVNMALPSCVGIHADIVAPYLVQLTTEEQKQRWLPASAPASCSPRSAMTEPTGGSDLAALKTTAVKDGDDWIINGSKTFITNGYSADLVVVAARTSAREEGPGHHAVRRRDRHATASTAAASSTRSASTSPTPPSCSSTTCACRRRQRHRRGRPRLHPHDELAAAGAPRLGRLQPRPRRADPRRDDPVRQGPQGLRAADRPLQQNKFLLADLVTRVEVTQAYVDNCVPPTAPASSPPIDAAKAKWWTAQVQNEVLDHCVQLHGGYGYMNEYRVARAWMDARVTKIWAGSNEIMKELIGRDLGL